jgi:hypothetical protein
MKRLFTAVYLPQQGGVYRTLPDGNCLELPDFPEITPPGCSSFPVHDNNYGALPTFFEQDVEVDAYAWDYRFSSLGPASQDPTFVNMWGLLSASHQNLIRITGCYCIGEGIDRPGLTINRPSFPSVAPLSFFRVQQIGGFASFTVRDRNPDDVAPGYCCTSDDDEPEQIKMSYEDGQLVAYRIRKDDKEQRYITTDVHSDFRAEFGFPRWCCLEDPCTPGKHVYRWLHFPRWLNDVWDPVDGNEPIGILPVIVDLQCDPVTGDFYIYRANLLFYDGVLYDVEWNASEPRETVGAPEPSEAPTAPNQLPYDEDYQGNQLLPDLVALAGEPCDNLCADASFLLGEFDCVDECNADVCADGFEPDPVLPTYVYETPVGMAETGEEAVETAKENVLALSPCAGELQEPLAACFVKRIGESRWRVGIAVCCEE